MDSVSSSATNSARRNTGLKFTWCFSHLRERIDMSASSKCWLLRCDFFSLRSLYHFHGIGWQLHWRWGLNGMRAGGFGPRRGGRRRNRNTSVQSPGRDRGQFLLFGVEWVPQRQLNLSLSHSQSKLLGVVGRNQQSDY